MAGIAAVAAERAAAVGAGARGAGRSPGAFGRIAMLDPQFGQPSRRTPGCSYFTPTPRDCVHTCAGGALLLRRCTSCFMAYT